MLIPTTPLLIPSLVLLYMVITFVKYTKQIFNESLEQTRRMSKMSKSKKGVIIELFSDSLLLRCASVYMVSNIGKNLERTL